MAKGSPLSFIFYKVGESDVLRRLGDFIGIAFLGVKLAEPHNAAKHNLRGVERLVVWRRIDGQMQVALRKRSLGLFPRTVGKVRVRCDVEDFG